MLYIHVHVCTHVHVLTTYMYMYMWIWCTCVSEIVFFVCLLSFVYTYICMWVHRLDYHTYMYHCVLPSCMCFSPASVHTLVNCSAASSCFSLTSCEDCTPGCLWCPSLQQCLPSNSYNYVYVYGQCLGWVNVRNSCPGGWHREHTSGDGGGEGRWGILYSGFVSWMNFSQISGISRIAFSHLIGNTVFANTIFTHSSRSVKSAKIFSRNMYPVCIRACLFCSAGYVLLGASAVNPTTMSTFMDGWTHETLVLVGGTK